MRRRLAAVALLVLAAACAPPLPPSAPTPAAPPRSTATPSDAELERQIHSLVNRHRAAQGLPPLASDDRVAEMARRHSQSMAAGRRRFGHDRFDERSGEIARFLPVRAVAENVAFDGRSGGQLADLVVQGWVASAGHRRNIEGTFQVSGIGVARAPDGLRYFTQIFVSTQQ